MSVYPIMNFSEPSLSSLSLSQILTEHLPFVVGTILDTVLIYSSQLFKINTITILIVLKTEVKKAVK